MRGRVRYKNCGIIDPSTVRVRVLYVVCNTTRPFFAFSITIVRTVFARFVRLRRSLSSTFSPCFLSLQCQRLVSIARISVETCRFTSVPYLRTHLFSPVTLSVEVLPPYTTHSTASLHTNTLLTICCEVVSDELAFEGEPLSSRIVCIVTRPLPPHIQTMGFHTKTPLRVLRTCLLMRNDVIS